MKTLYIMRHAKSSWDDFSISDFDRSLNERGEKEAPLMGKVLKDLEVKPDLILSSPANRAQTTAEIVADVLGYDVEDIHYQKSIYESSLMNLIMMVRELPKDKDSVLLFGHNPALTALINNLCDFSLDNLPTAGVVAIEFESTWADVSTHSGKKLFFEYPKKHQG